MSLAKDQAIFEMSCVAKSSRRGVAYAAIEFRKGKCYNIRGEKAQAVFANHLAAN